MARALGGRLDAALEQHVAHEHALPHLVRVRLGVRVRVRVRVRGLG